MPSLVALAAIPNSVGTIQPGQTFTATAEHAAALIVAGQAVPESAAPNAKWVDGLRWPGATVVVMASGPSLTGDQCEAVRAWRAVAPAFRKVIVINTTFRRAPWADVLYACDETWWRVYAPEVVATFGGERWTQDRKAIPLGVRYVKSERSAGLGRRPGVINQGSNSGYQAINLAWQAGAVRILLLGFDMKRTGGMSHWHGDHPKALAQALPFDLWLPQFVALAADLAAEHVPVLNCTPGSALRAFPMASLSECLR